MKKIYSFFLLCALSISAYSQDSPDVNHDGKVNSANVVSVYNAIINGWTVPSDNEFTVNGVSFKMIKVEGGTFDMGATPEQDNPYDAEKPVHKVTLSDYLIGETEVTQALWEAVMGKTIHQIAQEILSDYLIEETEVTQALWEAVMVKTIHQIAQEIKYPTFGVGQNYPMYYITWYDCQDFITRLNQMTNRNFRLPTEAEWEYAARGGNHSRGTQYSGAYSLENCGWYKSNSDSSTHPVATKQANELGIYDMSGNLSEMCQDWYGDYNSMNQTNSSGHKTGTKRVSRGGSWDSDAKYCRYTYRTSCEPDWRSSYLGFRLALSE